jgi:hypothetical protein
LPEAEHGFLLLLLLASKLDSRSPLPVPPEVLLYEAYMAGETPLPDPLLAGLVTSAQTSVTAENELCDVAGRYSDRLAALGEKTGSGAVFLHLLSTLVAHDAKGYGADNAMLLALPWGLRVLAHGRAALCFDGRKQADKARVEWDRVVALAAEVGIPEADLALIQSYAAYRAKDWPQTRIHLHRASNSSLLTPEEREHFVQMAERFDEKDPGALESTLDRAFVARTLLGIADQRLRKAGVYDVLLQLPKVVATRVALEALSHPALSVEPAGLWQRVRGLWDSSVGE